MEYLKAWIFLQHKLRDNGEEIDEILLKYVEQIYDNLTNLVNTKLVERTQTGNFKVAELTDLQVENRILKNIVSEMGIEWPCNERDGKPCISVKGYLFNGTPEHKMWQNVRLEKFPGDY